MTPAMRSGRLLRRADAAAGSGNARPDTESEPAPASRSLPRRFPDNQIPANRFNPASVYLLENFAPLPNLPQTGLPNRNYQYLQKIPVDKDQFTGASISTRARFRSGSAATVGPTN